jgi:hypothetical protein
MGLSRHANQRDGNEKPIVDALRQIGASVYVIDKPCDLLVGYRGRNFLLEVKLPLGPRGGSSHSNLNDAQEDFEEAWHGQFDVVRSAVEAIEIVVGPVPPEEVITH